MNKSRFHRRNRLFKSRTFRCTIIWLTGMVGLLLFLFLTGEEICAFKLVDARLDRWYGMQGDRKALQVRPDESQPPSFPYLLRELNQRTIASESLSWTMRVSRVLKESDDGAGNTWRNTLCDTIGFKCFKSRSLGFVSIPTSSAQRQSWKTVASLAIQATSL